VFDVKARLGMLRPRTLEQQRWRAHGFCSEVLKKLININACHKGLLHLNKKALAHPTVQQSTIF
jgi:hypothetical protein